MPSAKSLSLPNRRDFLTCAAASALARLKTKRGTEALLKLWERDPEGVGPHVRHALSMAAGERLDDLDAARAWAATLE